MPKQPQPQRATAAERRAERRAGAPSHRSPWVIDTRDVGRRAGSMREYRRAVPAPGEAGGLLGLPGILTAPPGSDVDLDVRVESVVEGVLVTGTVSMDVTGECSRCLDPIEHEVTVDVTELYAYPDSATDTSTDADEVSRVVDDLIDLEPIARNELLLALPQAPLCDEDCQGLCPECGGRRADLGPDHRHETMDPRWAALARTLGDIEEENE